MAAGRFVRAATVMCISVVMGVRHTNAEERRVVDELLDILRQNKQITEQQYRQLKQRAEVERQEDMRRQVSAPAPTPAPDTMRAYFKEGYNVETADGNFKLNIGGRAQIDWNVSDPGGGVKEQFGLVGTPTGVEFRRARLSLAGLLYGLVDYKFEYDFADGEPAFKDVYIGLKKVPYVQYIRVGYFKEPFSLEELTSDDFVTFQERALPNAFAPSRNTGFALMPVFFAERVTASAGAFRDTNDFGRGFGSEQLYNVSARVTGLPWYEEKGRELVHLGFSYAHQFRHDDVLAFSQRPESHLFPAKLVNTGDIVSDGADLINPEAAVVYGPWSVQGEYMRAFVAQSDNPNLQFDGFYVQASYFLTGEHRRYRPATGAFEKPIPIRNFMPDGSAWGAWELAARFSRLDLDSENIHGGAEDNISGEVNWYLNPNTKVGANYVWAHLESVGDTNILQGRFQLTY